MSNKTILVINHTHKLSKKAGCTSRICKGTNGHDENELLYLLSGPKDYQMIIYAG
jgi:hypothetical protein